MCAPGLHRRVHLDAASSHVQLACGRGQDRVPIGIRPWTQHSDRAPVRHAAARRWRSPAGSCKELSGALRLGSPRAASINYTMHFAANSIPAGLKHQHLHVPTAPPLHYVSACPTTSRKPHPCAPIHLHHPSYPRTAPCWPSPPRPPPPGWRAARGRRPARPCTARPSPAHAVRRVRGAGVTRGSAA